MSADSALWVALAVLGILGLAFLLVRRARALPAPALLPAPAPAPISPSAAAATPAFAALKSGGLAAPSQAAIALINEAAAGWDACIPFRYVEPPPFDGVSIDLARAAAAVGTDTPLALQYLAGATGGIAGDHVPTDGQLLVACRQALLDGLALATKLLTSPLLVGDVTAALSVCEAGLSGLASQPNSAGLAASTFAAGAGSAIGAVRSALAAGDWSGAQSGVEAALASTRLAAFQDFLGPPAASPLDSHNELNALALRAAAIWSVALIVLLAPPGSPWSYSG